ncbi:nitroreductase family deazaflavin-dependent oxidoreductase [Streptomyces sp. NPDC047002]|uniref:nitroreductase family deazaflavin-dependent oxidoreductase n=1 Tax=Streptomyces sp. NPDC047002 TaxID=3155475 RepID=UPI0034512A6A
MLFQETHIKAYEETAGAIGHEWQPGLFTLILHTVGRSSGLPRKFAVIYRAVEDSFVVVASRGGHDRHPNWYLNLLAHPEVGIQVGPDHLRVRARTAVGAERDRLWPLMVETFPTYAEYQAMTDRVIPVVVLDRT